MATYYIGSTDLIQAMKIIQQGQKKQKNTTPFIAELAKCFVLFSLLIAICALVLIQ